MERTIFEVIIGTIWLVIYWAVDDVFTSRLTAALFFAWPIVSITKVFADYPLLKLISKVLTIGVVLWALLGVLLFVFGFTGMDINVNGVFRYLVG